ncbi:MAG: zinc-binding alcohol dehydrogenase family protein [Hyphomicrobiales bacterium]
MKALVYTAPQTLTYQDMPDPVPAVGDALLRIESAGICGSDMHAFLGHDDRRPAPLILGHEVCGTVLSGTTIGQRVTVNPLVTCGKCAACTSGRDNLCPDRQIISMQPREGGFANFLSMPERNLVAVPDAITSDQAALAEPIACGWHAVRLGEAMLANTSGARGLVIGGGPIGLGAALSLKAQGIDDVLIIEPNGERRAFLEEHCNQTTAAPDALGSERQFELVIDGVGIEASRAQASAHATPGGVIVHIGLGSASGGLDVRRLTLQEITFLGTYTYTAQDFRDTAAAMFAGQLGSLDWTRTWPLADGQAAFEALRAGSVAQPKIVLKPND